MVTLDGPNLATVVNIDGPTPYRGRIFSMAMILLTCSCDQSSEHTSRLQSTSTNLTEGITTFCNREESIYHRSTLVKLKALDEVGEDTESEIDDSEPVTIICCNCKTYVASESIKLYIHVDDASLCRATIFVSHNR